MRRILALSLIGLLTGLAPATENTSANPQPTSEGKRATKERAGEHVDPYGDPLPAAAAARLGTRRLRHAREVLFVGFSPDGRQVVSVAPFEGVAIWDAATGRLRRRVPLRSTVSPSGTAISKDGKSLALVSGTAAQLWNLISGERIARFRFQHAMGHGKPDVALAPDAKTLAVTYGGQIHLWDVASREKRYAIKTPGVASVVFSPDGETMASVTGRDKHGGPGKGLVCLWNAATGKNIRTFKAPGAISVAISPDGRMLAAANKGHKIHLWDIQTGRPLATLQSRGSDPWLYSRMAFSPDGRFLASAANTLKDHVAGDSPILIWDLKTGKEAARCSGHDGHIIFSLAFSPDSRTLVSGGGDQCIRLWDTTSGKERRIAGHESWPTQCAVFSADGKVVATGSRRGFVALWDASTGRQRWESSGHTGHNRRVTCLAMSRDGRILATGSGGKSSICLWDAATGRLLHEFPGHSVRVCSLSFSPDGKMLTSVDWYGTLRRWEVKSGKRILELPRTGYRGRSAFSGGGRLVASAGRDGGVPIWDTVAGRDLISTGKGPSRAKSMCFSCDSQLLVTAHEPVTVQRPGGARPVPGGLGPNALLAPGLGRSSAIHVWDVATGARLVDFQTPVYVGSVVFSPDDTIVASSGLDGVFRLWDVLTGKSIAEVRGHDWPGRDNRRLPRDDAVAFSPDGRRLATVGRDGTVLLWDLEAVIGTKELLSADAATPEALWKALGSKDASEGYRASVILARRGHAAVRFLTARLKPVSDFPSRDPAHIKKLIADLNADKYAVRQKAYTDLARLRRVAEPALRKAQENKLSPEAASSITGLLEALNEPLVLSSQTLREARAVAILEWIGTDKCRQVLQRLAAGDAGAPLTRRAKAALRRLGSAKENTRGTRPDGKP